MANIVVTPPKDGTDLSEWTGGPPLIAVPGNDKEDSDYRLGSREYAWHSHARGQLLCVDTGLIQIRTPRGAWVLPPHRAGWIPPGMPHRVRVSGALTGWSLLLSPDWSRMLSPQAQVVAITELMRAAVRRAVTWTDYSSWRPEQERIAAVLLDELRQAPQEALCLPIPEHPRITELARRLLTEPGGKYTLADCADAAAMSPRTLRRHIQAHTGMSFGQWRQQALLIRGMEMLARGVAVAAVSDELGYASPSNFIAMFRRAFGDSPARFFARQAPT
ncbi:helix-turn-helix transcriptional regulator [Chromobacterium haemolyticum]|uniref:AraC family transcriptional regulator n=1 Tax=Chromobacterium TaxID=535 RepID=UPI00188823D0|nr:MULTISPECIES: helix-turn-helix transcriptional regulator [Chromobacterium]QOZ82095.1 AraC family transcriptional regulator [Chromobacterium sp. Rain0013]UGA40101.1 helix-turn-helix transcriptional regulator [Chromobacterium haemolyticum]WON82108.1 helix-turn-helix transcriptional regulator [Chromobacterium haemolyticum]